MLKECLEVFSKQLDEYGDKLIIDTYIPPDGTYIIVSPKEDTFEIKEVVNIKYNKKTKELEGRANNYFQYLCECDYNSKLVDMNKPIDGKKIIHSNNYISFWIKKENLINGKLTNEIIENYYNTLLNPEIKYSKSKNAVDLYKSIEDEIGKVDSNLLNKIKGWIKENIFKLNVEITGKDYLKIFFEYPIENFKKEGKRYLIPNIYNNNDFNIKLGDKIYGVPNDNMGMNGKKPYLENKSRKETVPYLIDNNEVLLQRKFFDYLMNNAAIGKVNLYIDTINKTFDFYENGSMPKKDFTGLYLRLQKGKEVEIHDYDIISCYKYNIIKKFDYKNILKLDLTSKNVSIQKYGSSTNVKDMQDVLNEVLFSKILIRNYFTDPADIKINDGCLKNNLLLARETIFNYIYKGDDTGIYGILNKVSLNLIKGSIEKGHNIKACHQFNLRWSLNEYFKKGNDNMADILSNIKNDLRLKINDSVTGVIDNDKEYYFAIGQVVSYLLSKNKGNKKVQSLANPFINGRNNAVIKEKLRNFYKRYNYDIDMHGRRFKNLYAMIIGYEPESKVDQDMIIAGFLHSNLIYESNKGDE